MDLKRILKHLQASELAVRFTVVITGPRTNRSLDYRSQVKLY